MRKKIIPQIKGDEYVVAVEADDSDSIERDHRSPSTPSPSPMTPPLNRLLRVPHPKSQTTPVAVHHGQMATLADDVIEDYMETLVPYPSTEQPTTKHASHCQYPRSPSPPVHYPAISALPYSVLGHLLPGVKKAEKTEVWTTIQQTHKTKSESGYGT